MENFKYNTVEEAIAAIKAGKMVLVTDDEDRENEGDYVEDDVVSSISEECSIDLRQYHI